MSVFIRKFYFSFAVLALFLLLSCDITDAGRMTSSGSKSKSYSSVSSGRISKPSQGRGYASADIAKFSYGSNQPANYIPKPVPVRKPANPDIAKFSYTPSKPIEPVKPSQNVYSSRVQQPVPPVPVIPQAPSFPKPSAPVMAPAPIAPIMHTPNQQTASSYLSPSYHSAPSYPSAPLLPNHPQTSQPIGWTGSNDFNKPQFSSSGQSFSQFPSGGSSFPSNTQFSQQPNYNIPSSNGFNYPKQTFGNAPNYPIGGSNYPIGSNYHVGSNYPVGGNYPIGSNYPVGSNYPMGGIGGYNQPPPPIHTVVHQGGSSSRGGIGVGSAVGGFAAGYLANDLASSVGKSFRNRPVEYTSSTTIIMQQPTQTPQVTVMEPQVTNMQPAPIAPPMAQPIEPIAPSIPLAPYPENSPFAPLNVNGPTELLTTTVPTIEPEVPTIPSVPVTDGQGVPAVQPESLPNTASTAQNLPEITATQTLPDITPEQTSPAFPISDSVPTEQPVAEPQDIPTTIASPQEPTVIDNLPVILVTSNIPSTISSPAEEQLTTTSNDAQPIIEGIISSAIPIVDEKLTTLLPEDVPVSESVNQQTTTNLLNAQPTISVPIPSSDPVLPEESFNIRFATTPAAEQTTIIADEFSTIPTTEVVQTNSTISTTQITEETTTSPPTIAPVKDEKPVGLFSRFKSSIKKLFS